MTLKYADMVALSKADDGLLEDDAESLGRLVKADLMTEDGRLTDEGEALFQKVKTKEKLLRAGIPVERRTTSDKTAILEGSALWATGRVSNQPLVTNGEVIFVGKPITAMAAKPAPPDVKKRFPQTIAACLKGKFVQLWPHSFQLKRLGEFEMIWLANKDQSVKIPIQVKYFDFLADKFPKGKWFGQDVVSAVQIRVTNRGLKNNVVALLMPYSLQGTLADPKDREGWPT